MTDKLSKKLDISKNILILSCVTLILGFLLFLSLIICVAIGTMNVQGVKELLGILGGILVSPSAIIFLRKLFSCKEVKDKKKK